MKNAYIVYFNDFGKVVVIADDYTGCERDFNRTYDTKDFKIKKIELIENVTKEVIY